MGPGRSCLEGDISVSPKIVDRVERSILAVTGDLFPYIQFEPLHPLKMVEIRHLWMPPGWGLYQRLPNRPDLDIEFDMINWQQSLSHHVARMSAIHDPGNPPSVLYLKHILDQFWDPTSRSFGVGQSSLHAPIYFVSLKRPSDT